MCWNIRKPAISIFLSLSRSIEPTQQVNLTVTGSGHHPSASESLHETSNHVVYLWAMTVKIAHSRIQSHQCSYRGWHLKKKKGVCCGILRQARYFFFFSFFYIFSLLSHARVRDESRVCCFCLCNKRRAQNGQKRVKLPGIYNSPPLYCVTKTNKTVF